jgi:hypothetical protein
MATKQQALKAIAAAGVELDQDMVACDNFTLDAPAGQIFRANGEPSYLAGNYDRDDARFGFGPTMGQIYDDIIMACNMGLADGVGSEQ